MKSTYEELEIQVIMFEEEDVITTSPLGGKYPDDEEQIT